MNCRHCNSLLSKVFVDLGFAPPSNAYLKKEELTLSERYFPLKTFVCENCWLVQTMQCEDEINLFQDDYAYFSSTSKSWLNHAKAYAERVIEDLNLTSKSFVVEIASNDGYLLRNFQAARIPCLGIEPTAETANVAVKQNINVLCEFFTKNLACDLKSQGKRADLIVGNNVYAHVPDINDFTRGLKVLLNSCGTINLEFPHLLNLLSQNQFDTIYHEHFSYLSLRTVITIFKNCGLRVYRVEEISTHGGSLRIFGCHDEDLRVTEDSVADIIQREELAGLFDINTYFQFQSRIDKIKQNLLMFLISCKRDGKSVMAYGAAAKGSTLLNFAGVKSDLIQCVFDAADSKVGKFLPGSHIPIYSAASISKYKPDYLLILPWNLVEEICLQENILKDSGTKFVIAIPDLKILD